MATNIGNHLKVWLNFQHSPTEDLKGNTWTSHGNPNIGTTNAFNGNALQLDGQSYIKLSDIELGGQDFYIDGWVYVDPASPNYARIISVVNPTNGCHMFSFRKSPNDSSKLDIWVNETADVSVDSGFTSTERNTASVRQRVHFQIIYRYADFTFILCINDRTQAYGIGSGDCPQYTRQKFDIYIGALPNGNQGLIGSIDELRIYDGTWFSYGFGNVPTTSDYNSVYFNADIKTDIHNSLSEWRYENAGYADLLITSGTTVTGLTPTQSKTGTAFYQAEKAKCFDIPSTKAIWIKCDVYCNLTDRWRMYNGGANGSTGLTSQTSGEASLFANGTNVKQFTSAPIKKNQLQTVLLHMVSDSSAGIVEVWLDGTKLYTYTGNVNNGDAFADIYLQSDGAGTFFSNVIISPVEIGLDENTTLALNVTCDLLRFFPSVYIVSLDTARNVLWQVPLNIDTCRFVTHSVLIDADIQSTVIYTVQLNCDAIRTLPHDFILSPVEKIGDVPDTSNDGKALTQSIEIRLNEQSLTDEVVIVTVRPVDIMEQVKGQYLDYKYNMRAETCKQRGILNTCTCCSDIDEILYKQLEYTIPEDECWHNVDTDSSLTPTSQEMDEEYALASTHIKTIANIIGKTPVLQFADFISTVDITAGGTTYNDLIRSIFGWTARIPQMMINCYLRDDKLFVVQRGHEANVIDFSHLKIDFAGIDREVKRTIWGSKPWAKTEVNEIRGLPWKNLITAPWSEKSSDNTVYTYYTDGLVWTATTTNGNSETVTTYYYHSFDNNGRRCLTEEITEVFENKKLIDRNITYHNQLGQGQKHILSTDADGEYLGSVMGNSNGDDRVTPYSAYTYINGQKQAVIAIQHGYDKIKQERTLYGISSFDTSFPVHGDDKLIEITKAIKWLNRRTQETVTLNLFDYPHVLDFNDRLVFNGNYYFLKSNTALKTPRIVNKQTVAMVRWY